MAQYGNDGDSIIDNESGEVMRTEPTGGLQQVITAEINQAVATAHQYPRRRDQVIINEIVGRSTLDEEIASECSYTLKRGNKQISGPSIRFAEIVRASYGNIRVASRFVALDMADPERAAVIVEAVALDLEMNQSEIIPNRRSIMTSASGNRRPQIYSADMINMTVNAASSIARRNAILSVVPKVLWQTGYQRVVKVLMGDADTLVQRRERMIESFARFDVSPEMLFAALDIVHVKDIKVDHMPAMIGMLTAIKDGEPVDSVLGRGGVTEKPKFVGAGNVLKDDPSPSGESVKQAEETMVTHRAGVSKEQDVKAHLVVTSEGVVESDSGASPTMILDKRFEDPRFVSYQEWIDACDALNFNTKFALPWQSGAHADGESSVDDDFSDSNPAGRDHPATEPAGKAAGEGAVAGAAKSAASPAVSQAGPASSQAAQKPAGKVAFEDDEAYIAHMRDVFDAAKSKAAIDDVWKATRDDRRELLGADQTEALTNEKNDALARVKSKGGPI